jgi:PfaD family protein
VQEIAFDAAGIAAGLARLDRPCFLLRVDGRVGLATAGEPAPAGSGAAELLALSPPSPPASLGDPEFRAEHGVELSYMAGAMAAGIASEELVIALGRVGLLGSFGAAGLLPDRVGAAIDRIQRALPQGPYAFNLIHSPSEEAIERETVRLYLERGVRTVEASAFLRLTSHVVRYRVAGLEAAPDGSVRVRNRVIAKVSRREVAEQFLSPAPAPLLRELVAAGWISEAQARLAERVPMADDVTVEADSGGHTDNRPLVVLLPSIQAQCDELRARWGYARAPRVGAAGGIGTPAAAAAAFAMGAAYVVTGSVNQGCVEAGTAEPVRRLLAGAGYADVAMAPAADMFEAGVKVQLLKRGTMFPMRAQRLYDLYQRHASMAEIPAPEREQIERQLFRRPLDAVWRETVEYFAARDPEQVERAGTDPRRRMALVFRWYLGLSSRWANAGEPGREMDYQIWCGPAMGAFNDWARGSYLESPENRSVADVARQIMTGAAYLGRVAQLRAQGARLPSALAAFRPARPS